MAAWCKNILRLAVRGTGAALAIAAAPVCAHDVDLLSPATIAASADLRVAATNGEQPWSTGQFGKLRYGDEAGPRVGNADLVWRPQFGWAVSATVVASYVGGPRDEAGISEAYFTIRPRLPGTTRAAARIGLMWAPASLEHTGADWHVADTITPSAINSWIGEEVRPLAAEAKVSFDLAGGRVETTAALFTANDTAGTLLALRGWAMHDRKTLVGQRQLLPPLSGDVAQVQPPYTHPTIYLGQGFARHPGTYLKLGWAPAAPVRLEVFHYDNRANPEDVNAEYEWGWHTRFDQIAFEARLGGATRLRAQALAGRTRMGLPDDSGRRWVDCDFRSAFGLLSHDFKRGGVALRGEAFSTRQEGTLLLAEDGETGWATTFAAHRTFNRHLALWVEALHIDSDRAARQRAGVDAHQRQDQLQLVMRGNW